MENMTSGFRIVARGKAEYNRRDIGSMRAPYGLEIIENCVTCPHREDRLFCNLPPAALQGLAAITSAASYPKGATLFVEAQAPRGVFALCAGRVKLSTTSIDVRTLIVRISETGEVLGLPATVTGKPCSARSVLGGTRREATPMRTKFPGPSLSASWRVHLIRLFWFGSHAK